MVNIILVALLINQLILMLNKKQPSALGCGLIGFQARDGQDINWEKFKLIMWANESRGSHSTGIYTKHGDYKALNKASLFLGGLNIDYDTPTPFALGHTRAPSVGMNRTIDAAQPIIYADEDVTLSLIHNGTIHNIDVLATAAGIEHATTETDSQVLAKFLMARDYTVLKDYRGAASLIWTRTDEPDIVYVFRGESLSTEYAKTVSVERPLVLGYTNEGVYFSSLDEPLKALLTKDERESIETVPANIIFKFTGASNEIVEEIDRSNSHQSKPVYVAPKTNFSNHNYNTSKKSKTPFKEDKKTFTYPKVGSGSDLPSTINSSLSEYDELDRDNDNTFWVSRAVAGWTDGTLAEETLGHTNNFSINEVFFFRGRYRTENMILNGLIYISKTDNRISSSTDPDATKYGFVKGVLLKTHEDFTQAISKAFRHRFGTLEFEEALTDYAQQPIPVLETTHVIELESIYWEGFPFSGDYRPSFKHRGVLEFFSGQYGCNTLIKASELKSGDKVYIDNDLSSILPYVGEVISTSPNTGRVTIRKTVGETPRQLDDSVIRNIYSRIKTVREEANIADAVKIEKAAAESAKVAELEAKFAEEKRVKDAAKERLKTKDRTSKSDDVRTNSDFKTILISASEELDAIKSHADDNMLKIPKVVKRSISIISKAIYNL